MYWHWRWIGYAGLRSALRDQHLAVTHWKDEPIVRESSGKSWFTEPGRIVRFARPLNPLPFTAITDGELEYGCVEVAYYEAQEFKTVRYRWERKDFFNRRSGRYLQSELKRIFDDGRVWEDYQTRDDIPNLTAVEVAENAR